MRPLGSPAWPTPQTVVPRRGGRSPAHGPCASRRRRARAPHVVACDPEPAGLDPDDDLVEVQAAGLPGRFDERSALLGVPLVDRGVRSQGSKDKAGTILTTPAGREFYAPSGRALRPGSGRRDLPVARREAPISRRSGLGGLRPAPPPDHHLGQDPPGSGSQPLHVGARPWPYGWRKAMSRGCGHPLGDHVWGWASRRAQGPHPTQKPVELFRRPIEYHTVAGDIVLDPFAGSGRPSSRRADGPAAIASRSIPPMPRPPSSAGRPHGRKALAMSGRDG